MTIEGIPWLTLWFNNVAKLISDNLVEINELDRIIGDGDHAENLDRGLSKVVENLRDGEFETPAKLLQLVAQTVLNEVAGTSGALLGTAFLRASKAAGEKIYFDEETIVDILSAANRGIVERGKAEVGHKTMVDAWTPAVAAAEQELQKGSTIGDILKAAVEHAQAGADATAGMVAHKGRSSYLGERSLGHKDPGAVSTALLLQAALTSFNQLDLTANPS